MFGKNGTFPPDKLLNQCIHPSIIYSAIQMALICFPQMEKQVGNQSFAGTIKNVISTHRQFVTGDRRWKNVATSVHVGGEMAWRSNWKTSFVKNKREEELKLIWSHWWTTSINMQKVKQLGRIRACLFRTFSFLGLFLWLSLIIWSTFHGLVRVLCKIHIQGVRVCFMLLSYALMLLGYLFYVC